MSGCLRSADITTHKLSLICDQIRGKSIQEETKRELIGSDEGTAEETLHLFALSQALSQRSQRRQGLLTVQESSGSYGMVTFPVQVPSQKTDRGD